MDNNISLDKFSTNPPKEFKKKKTKKKLKEIAEEIGELQRLFYADGSHSLLVVFQGMDSSGKDGATREVFKYCSPMVVSAYGFKKPSSRELEHDFLWRVHQKVPRQGRIQVFNRSHYEDILVPFVEGNMTTELRNRRMQAINSFEHLLRFDNNTTILKFYMHLSYQRQEEKLMERIEEPHKQWKHNDADWQTRKNWASYMETYEYIINHSEIPWIIAPVDKRWYRNYFIAEKVRDALRDLNLKNPTINSERWSAKE